MYVLFRTGSLALLLDCILRTTIFDVQRKMHIMSETNKRSMDNGVCLTTAVDTEIEKQYSNCSITPILKQIR